MLKSLSILTVLSLSSIASAAFPYVSNFEDVTVPTGGFVNGGPVTNKAGFTSGGVRYYNSYDSRFGGFWSGFSISNVSNTTTAGFTNQYAAYTGSGVGGSGNYGVYFQSSAAFIELPPGTAPQSIAITNTTYAALSMLNGGSFGAKKYGGPTGNDPDYLSVTFTGYTGAAGGGTPTGSVEFFLADFRFADNSLDYIVSTWNTLDLTPLGDARSIKFSFASSDVGDFGINTPTYFAADNLTFIPEPSSLAGLLLAPLMLKRRR